MLAFVMRRLDGISRSKAKAILSSGGVIVDDKVQTRHDFAVKPDMVVKISRHRQPQAAVAVAETRGAKKPLSGWYLKTNT